MLSSMMTTAMPTAASAATDHTHSRELCGAWESIEAFGNTSLDWSQALKDRAAQLAVTFTPDGAYDFALFARDEDDSGTGERVDVTARFRHVVARKGRYELRGANGLVIIGDASGIEWTYQREEGDTLRLRLEGAKRFGRCKGVDVIYFQRVVAAT